MQGKLLLYWTLKLGIREEVVNAGITPSSSVLQSGNYDPCSSGIFFVRLEMSTGTDWPRLEDPFVEVVLPLG